jgi:hypothetical protein
VVVVKRFRNYITSAAVSVAVYCGTCGSGGAGFWICAVCCCKKKLLLSACGCGWVGCCGGVVCWYWGVRGGGGGVFC